MKINLLNNIGQDAFPASVDDGHTWHVLSAKVKWSHSNVLQRVAHHLINRKPKPFRLI
jgi:hypothetical protein